MYTIIRNKYKRHEITAYDVWAYVDEGVITATQATKICGPRPKPAGE